MPKQSASSKDTYHASRAEKHARGLIAQMTLVEKIGQMTQLNGGADDIHQAIREGRVGSVLNEVNIEEVNEIQRLAMQETRLGIPLLIGRDVGIIDRTVQ